MSSMSYLEAREAIREAQSYATDVDGHMYATLLKYVKEIEDRLQSALEVNHLWDGS